MPEIIFPEWRNNNAHTQFPFSDLATLINAAGVRIEEDLFLDARVYAIGVQVGAFLRRIEVDDTTARFWIADPINGEICSGTTELADPQDTIPLLDQYGRPAGILVSTVEKMAIAVNSYPKGDTIFEQVETEFAPTVVIPMPDSGVRGVLLDDGNILAGDVWLVGADGIVLQLLDDGVTIQVDMVGDPYALLAACESEGFVTPRFCGLKTINQISPNGNGDFKLTIGGNLATANIMRIQQSNDSVQIETVGGLGSG